jgi:L-rhamnose mutarotase
MDQETEKHMKIAFKMQLKPGYGEEYQQRHRNIWPEMQQVLREAGISDYHIFLDPLTNALFAVQEVAEEKGSQDLAFHPVVIKWWKYMADIMETNEDFSPVAVPLKEVFYLP